MIRRLFGAAMLAGFGFVCGALAVGAAEGDKKVDTRVYELRTYYVIKGRMPNMLARFRDHTTKLFEKHGMKNIGYWTPTNPELAETRLIYVVSHDSAEAAKKSWDGFRSDPDWIKARDASEKDGKIVEKVESVYMTPTDFSALK